MTLDQAHKIAEIATDAFASKPRNNFCAKSKLHGHSFVEISRAFSLVTAARRQIAGDDAEMKATCEKFADLAGSLVASLDTMVVSDEQFERLAAVSDNSADRNRVLLEISHGLMDNKDQESRDEENPIQINSFCWTLNHRDPLYWQKVYTHLGLPYDESCPVGLPKEEQSDGKKSFFFPNMFCKYSFDTPRKKREERRSVIIFLCVAAIFIVWFLWWFWF